MLKILPITLRPHHFLCLQGYKGYNYSTKQAGIWDKTANILKAKPNTVITIGEGKDTLCQTCPVSKNKNSSFITCIEQNIQKLDEKVKEILGLKTNAKMKYSTVVKIMKEKITKEKHEELCSKCFWWQKGLCRDSFSAK